MQQEKDEGSADFLPKLKDQMTKYSGLNIDDPLGQGMLKFHFVIVGQTLPRNCIR
jgi:hypothetical protein